MTIEPECRNVSISSVWREEPQLSVALEKVTSLGQPAWRAREDQLARPVNVAHSAVCAQRDSGPYRRPPAAMKIPSYRVSGRLLTGWEAARNGYGNTQHRESSEN